MRTMRTKTWFYLRLYACCDGESLAHGPPENIFAFEGGDVILPCSFNITASSDFPTVEWSKEDLKPNVVFLYRDGCETYEMKDRAFEYRTSLIPKELKNGNISLRISNVRLSDAGTYQCMTLGRNMRRSIKKIELTVFFEPKLSVVSAECGGLTLQCEAKSSLSEPEITFLDDLGNNIAAEEAKRDEDAGGIYTVRRRVTLHSATNSITCRVYQPEFSLAKDQRMLIPADFRRCCFLIGISCVAVTLFLSVLVAGCVWKMCGKSGKCSVNLPENILAFEGGDVILPCSFNITANSVFPNVEWSKEDLEPNVVFLYRDGCETVEMKNPVFQYRTSFIPKELKNGNISVRISNVQLSDAGRYQCMTLWRNAPRDVTTVELIVGRVSEPKLSVISTDCGGLTVQCEANYSLPEPEITFLDDQGIELPAEDPRRDKDDRGNYTVRRRVTLHSATNSITCRVQQPESNLYRDTNIPIPADSMRFCFLTTIISVGGTLFVLELVGGLAVWLWKICGKSEEDKLSGTRRVSDQSASSITIERSHLEQINCADNVESGIIETLQREVALLKLELYERNQTIHQLLSGGVSRASLEFTKPLFPHFTQTLNTSILISDHIPNPVLPTHDKPPTSASFSQNMGPTPAIQKQNSNPTVHRRNSSPAALSVVGSHSSFAKRSKKKLSQSSSESYAQPDQKFARIKRRHSLQISSTTLSTNRYTLLADVTEESEPLI
ncbi:butyrophilin-like protein 2 isoform X2 [Channa argus]|uniref:butyrophilin-like protein 2 isoform X2 n=1 Tax=Channa argus TaxID=215402 RepID=UPI0035219D1A